MSVILEAFAGLVFPPSFPRKNHTSPCSPIPILGAKRCLHSRHMLTGMGPPLSCKIAAPSPRRCSGWPGFPREDIIHSPQKVTPKPLGALPFTPPRLAPLLPGGVRRRLPASQPLSWVETTYKWLNSDVTPSSACQGHSGIFPAPGFMWNRIVAIRRLMRRSYAGVMHPSRGPGERSTAGPASLPCPLDGCAALGWVPIRDPMGEGTS